MDEPDEIVDSPPPKPPPPTSSRFTEAVPRIIASCFSLAAFSVAVMTGVAHDNPAIDILLRGMISMVVCYSLGWGVGRLCQFVINNHIRDHQTANPAPDSNKGELERSSTDTDKEEVLRV